MSALILFIPLQKIYSNASRELKIEHYSLSHFPGLFTSQSSFKNFYKKTTEFSLAKPEIFL